MYSPDVLPPGAELCGGDYRIEEILGRGGFGITYRATDMGLGKDVAIKELLPVDLAVRDSSGTVRPSTAASTSDFQSMLDRALREARTFAKFRHTGIVSLYRVFTENGTAYQVFEFIDGLPLDDWLDKLGRKPSQVEIDRICDLLLDALEVLHRGGLVHRDVQPRNLLIRAESGLPVLIDFGTTRQAAEPAITAVVVTRSYSPMEAYASDARLIGPWSDIYGFAATLYLAITGQEPPSAPDRAMSDTLPPLSNLPGAWRSDFLKAVEWGLAVRAIDRPQSIAEWRGALMPGASHPRATVAAPASNVVVPDVVVALAPAKASEQRRPPLEPGTMLAGRYVLAELLGSGGFGLIYGARDLAYDIDVAMKELFPLGLTERDRNTGNIVALDKEKGAEYAELKTTTIIEAGKLARLHHPNIVNVFTHVAAHNTVYIVMGLVEGSTLADRVAHGTMTVGQAQLDDLLWPILSALEHMHGLGMVHGDVAPDNILLRQKDGAPVLVDLGASVDLNRNEKNSRLAKPGYSPFEKYAQSAKDVGPATDIYALSAVVYQLLTGELPPDCRVRLLSDTYKRLLPDARLKGYRQTFLAAIDHGLQVQVRDRPPSVAAWRAELDLAQPPANGTTKRGRKIFISYRREDTKHIAGRIYDHLLNHYSGEQVIFDVESIPLAVDFRRYIETSIGESAIVVALVGPRWLNRQWVRRWPNPFRRKSDDFIEIELELAFVMGTPILPLLVDDTEMPRAAELPARLRGFVDLNAGSVRSGRDFRLDMERVVAILNCHVPTRAEENFCIERTEDE